MKHLDITVDLETLSLSANAAILQIAAFPWSRDNTETPEVESGYPFEGYVDIRSCISDNFDFNPDTIKWWSEQKDNVKNAVLTPEPHPLKDVLENFALWIREMLGKTNARSVCLWAQGSDFDIAILRNAFSKYNMVFPIPRAGFRDARTYILELGAFLLMADNPYAGFVDPEQIYDRLRNIGDYDVESHNAVVDAYRTTWDLWKLQKRLKELRKSEMSFGATSASIDNGIGEKTENVES